MICLNGRKGRFAKKNIKNGEKGITADDSPSQSSPVRPSLPQSLPAFPSPSQPSPVPPSLPQSLPAFSSPSQSSPVPLSLPQLISKHPRPSSMPPNLIQCFSAFLGQSLNILSLLQCFPGLPSPSQRFPVSLQTSSTFPSSS